jgi:hypothetical protein
MAGQGLFPSMLIAYHNVNYSLSIATACHHLRKDILQFLL